MCVCVCVRVCVQYSSGVQNINEDIAQCVCISSDNATGVSLEDILMFITGSLVSNVFHQQILVL